MCDMRVGDIRRREWGLARETRLSSGGQGQSKYILYLDKNVRKLITVYSEYVLIMCEGKTYIVAKDREKSVELALFSSQC